MARITVEDCLARVENRFALVYATSKRTKALMNGAAPLYKCNNKDIVTALREIAAGRVRVVKEEKAPRVKKH
ncbi:MAG: DNA-directed RNA polymerase subunit omega [Deltaproteobacteria bacterium CG11_big_fil_rev_8_21_14_0_20_49_13]|nr:MAG: DNA-directed RNA polymerase subunit omega [Deltaproteobacteria bacterium CG11_big_fil_rev_8_21_14_0_20_49_13]